MFTSVLAVGCGSSTPAPRTAAVDNAATPAPLACLADRLPDPMPAQGRPIECAGAERSCADRCTQGVAAACVSLGYVFDQDPFHEGEAVPLYARGCELGDLNGCTNYGAYLLEGHDGLAADPPCAARLHERACQGDEAYGCGMFGRELALGVGVARDVERAWQVLETSCAELGSFACHALGLVLENGYLGVVDPAGAAAAFRRACETGNPESCPDADRLAAPP